MNDIHGRGAHILIIDDAPSGIRHGSVATMTMLLAATMGAIGGFNGVDVPPLLCEPPRFRITKEHQRHQGARERARRLKRKHGVDHVIFDDGGEHGILA